MVRVGHATGSGKTHGLIAESTGEYHLEEYATKRKRLIENGIKGIQFGIKEFIYFCPFFVTSESF